MDRDLLKKLSNCCPLSNQNWNKVGCYFPVNCCLVSHAVFLCAVLSEPEINERQMFIVHLAVAKVKETVLRLASEHRDLHSSVSKVGKTIDRVREPRIKFRTRLPDNQLFDVLNIEFHTGLCFHQL